jgi:putative tryptophan/tyrosine transport system substrate-binding protein
LVGGLMSYGTDVADMVSVYTGVILRGSRPVDLAVLQPTKFAFVLNKQRERLTPKTRSVFITMR